MTDKQLRGGAVMKTPEQIRAWLKSREWWPQFVKNTVEFDYRTAEVLGGDRGENTIRNAFFWLHAPEGLFFWMDRHREFKEWYSLTPFCRVIGNIHDNPELLGTADDYEEGE